jgi:hypothetical protein
MDQIEFNALSDCDKWRYVRDTEDKLKARNEKLGRVRIEARLVSSLLILDGKADTTKLDEALKDCEVGDALFD